MNDLILPLWYDEAGKLVDCISYKYIDNSWVDNDKRTYYYSTFKTVSVSNLSLTDYIIYPNPVSDILNINIPNGNDMFTFELYDAQGRKLISKEITNNAQLSLEGLAKGFYLYNLTIDGKIQSGKLIKE